MLVIGCGDGFCDSENGEFCNTCLSDCGTCKMAPPTFVSLYEFPDSANYINVSWEPIVGQFEFSYILLMSFMEGSTPMYPFFFFTILLFILFLLILLLLFVPFLFIYRIKIHFTRQDTLYSEIFHAFQDLCLLQHIISKYQQEQQLILLLKLLDLIQILAIILQAVIIFSI